MSKKSLKVLVISGASQGIGLASAQHFAKQGYKVINLSRSACPIPDVINISTDLLDHQWLAGCRSKLIKAVGTPEQLVLVHNAAMMSNDSVVKFDDDVLRQTLQLNVVAAAQLNKVLIPLMSPQSCILYVSSTLGTKAVADTYSYVVSKHAVVGQMRATCQDLAGTQIHTACVCPGFTETEMLKTHLDKKPGLQEEISATIALNRLVKPSEIADTLWFCSQNPVINGSVMHANLGQIER